MMRVAQLRSCRRCLGSTSRSRNGPPVHSIRSFSRSSGLNAYEDTIKNLKIGKHTKVLYQGFTGRQATVNAKESLEYGTNIVGGVKPGVEGEHLGLPVLPSVRVAAERLKPDASAIYVPGAGTVTAMEEAIEAEIPLIVAVAEHIPLHDLMRVMQMLKTQSKTRLVGANCPGIINTWGRCRLGFQPLPFFQEGRVGIVAKSGTLSYEVVASTTRAGLGQTYCISMGGDVVAGTNFIDAFKVFEEDDKTEGIIMVGEVGGRAELEAAEWIKEYQNRSSNPKPFAAIIGGINAPRGRIMGHAGAWSAPGEPGATAKMRTLESVGVSVVDHPEKVGATMKQLFNQRQINGAKSTSGPGAMQKRGYHTYRQRPRTQATPLQPAQKRNLYLKQEHAFNMLEERNVKTTDTPSMSPEYLLAVSIDRSTRSLCITASPSTTVPEMYQKARAFPFAYGSDEYKKPSFLSEVTKHLGVASSAQSAISKLVFDLVDIFMAKEAFMLETRIAFSKPGELQVQAAKFGFDDAAFKSAKRQKDVHALRDTSLEVPEDVEAEKYRMIYVRLEGEGTIGTIVNGAGLAMNTVDALIARGGHPANFMDTGGTASSDTVAAGFKLVTSDPRVKVVFCNIFGGLTLGDMIANGILMAFKELDMKVPVVVRIRGTNEKEGQQIIQNSGLKMDAFGRSKPDRLQSPALTWKQTLSKTLQLVQSNLLRVGNRGIQRTTHKTRPRPGVGDLTSLYTSLGGGKRAFPRICIYGWKESLHMEHAQVDTELNDTT